MKRIVLLALMVLSVVGCYDDAALWDQIMDHESRLVKLEALCNQMNTNIQSLQAIVTALQNNDYVTNVAPIKENGKDIGYTISFSKSGSVTIYHGADGKDGSNGKDGADGKDGHTPVIGIRQDSDGVWYWTLDGDWLLNDAGAKIPTTGADGKDGVNGTDGKDGADGKDGENGADGKDGVTPLLKIEEGYWYISYDNGLSWNKLDKATGIDGEDGKDGDSFFKSVTQDDDSVYLTLSDGTEFVLPKKSQPCSLVLDKTTILCRPGKTVTVGYVLQFDPEKGLPVITTMSEGEYKTKVRIISEDSKSGTSTGNIIITATSLATFGRVMVFVQSQGNLLAVESLEVGDGVDFREDEPANCYVVSTAGIYIFDAVMGNSRQAIEGISSVEVLWESFGTDETPAVGDLVQNVEYESGVITFRTADDFKEGNAVIAVKDTDGTILWSWHIWLTDQPEGQVYYNNAGTMMDRNLGATSAAPGDVGSLGLLYQWGRKDPFLGSSSIHYDSMAEAKSTITWPSSVKSDSKNGTIAFATANPTTFITSNYGNYDWYYTGSSSTDNTRWTTSESSKSIYDPCPAGWRVPDGGSNGVWSKAIGSSSSFSYIYSNSNEGMNFSGKFGSDQTIWYPASGYRVDHNGSLSYVGKSGHYWSASPANNHAYNPGFHSGGNVYPSLNDIRTCGRPVRCIQE